MVKTTAGALLLLAAPTLDGRFYLITMLYEESEPLVALIDANCQDRSLVYYDLDEPESALPALDLWGEPVVAPNGKTYRRSDTEIQWPQEWMKAFCGTDWSAERKATAAAARS